MTQPESPRQLSLGVSLRDDATFDNFYLPPDSENMTAVAALRNQLADSGEMFIYCWGAPGCGLTHLLQAACHVAGEQNKSAQFLPLLELVGYAPDVLLDGLEAQHLICLDGLQHVVGYPAWEEALFNLLNRIRDNGNHLLMCATSGPLQVPVQREDLRSRLAWGATFHIHNLDDAGKKSALQLRAKERGMELSDEVAAYILSRAPRDTNQLFYLLNQLDEISLVSQRRLTIPFVKEVLEGRV